MRFTVTALGASGGRTVAAAVAATVEYLLGPARGRDASPTAPGPGPEAGRQPGGPQSPDPGGTEGRAGAARYYADAGEGPGRWMGRGAVELGLAGTVGGEAFRSVLSGRHPSTGERLISARGSAGRVAELGAGTAARRSPDGEALYGIADVATVLGWSRTDVDDAAAEGIEMAASRIFATLAGTGIGSAPADPGTALIPVVDRDGSVLIPERELDRVEALVAASRSGKSVAAAGEADDVLSATDAARLIGTSTSYVARLCRTWDQHRAEIVAANEAGKPTRKAYVVAEREEDGAWRIRREDLAAFVERRRQPAVRVGYDVTATSEKSFSILALLGGPTARTEVLAAIEAANDAGLDWLERHAASARAGNEIVGVTGWTAASFQHLTSRRLDPFVHHHNVIANTVTDEHGVRRALDARRLYQRVAAASAVATAQARFELVSRLGVAFRTARRGGWEIAGITDEVVDEFSARSREIRETVHELEQAWGRSSTMAEFQAVVTSTRPPKKSRPAESMALEQWWARARARGLTPEALSDCLGRRRPAVLTARRRTAVLAALEQAVTAERSVFTRGDVLAALVDLPEPGAEHLGPIVVPAGVLEDLTDEFLASDRVVVLAKSSGRHDHLVRKDGIKVDVGGQREQEFSTVEMLAVQARALANYQAGFNAGTGIVPGPVLDETLARFPDLAGEQRDLVESFCTSGDAVQSAVGRPGTGKTFAMRAAVAAWEAAGYRVLGTAVKSEAARHLGEECAVRTEPLAWYLNRLDDPARSPLDARTVLVVDEASTVGDRELDALLTAARRDGAVVRLIGDPAQHGSVTAGGLWRVVTQRHEARTPELIHGQRVRHLDDRVAAEALRQGHAEDALAALESAGHLHIVEDERDLYVQLLTRWWDSRQSGAHHPMVDRRNDQRIVLNRLAQTMRRQLGELGNLQIAASGDRHYAVGDEVVARMNDRSLHPAGHPGRYIRNGASGTVIAVQPGDDPAADTLVVDFAGLGAIAVPRAFFDEHTDPWGRTDVGIDHAYAVTSYAVEGLTFPESSSHVDPQSTRSEVYVDITRGRDANHVFVTRADDPLDGERLPAVPAPAVDRQLEERLAASAGEPVAIALDPAAGAAALDAVKGTRSGRARDRVRSTRAARRIARQAVARPDPVLVERLGGEPPEVYLARRFRALLAEMALYRAQWQPRPGRTGPWVWALGEPTPDPVSQADCAALARRLSVYAAEVARRRLDCDLDPTAAAVVERLTAEGLFGRIAFDRAAAQLAGGAPVDAAIVEGAVAGTAPGEEPLGVA